MSQIQNNTLHNFFQPAAVLSVALLAGRYIEHFPGGTPRGLILAAGLGTGATLIQSKTCLFRRRNTFL